MRSIRISLSAIILVCAYVINLSAQGNVGIGTTTPSHPFQVNVDSAFILILSDQQAMGPNSFLTIASGQSAGQRVVVGVSGELSQVDLTLNYTGMISGTVNLEVRQGSVPGGTLLTQQNVTVNSSSASIYPVVFSAPLPVLNTGDSLFLELTYVSGSNVAWSKSTANPYAPGIAYLFTGSWTMLPGDDMIFKTYMNQSDSLNVAVFKVMEDGRVSIKDYSFPESDGTSGQVMMTNGNGEVIWAEVDSLASGVWRTAGNADTDSTHFLGTLDDQPLRFRLDSLKAGQWDGTHRNYSIGVGALDSVSMGIGNIAIGSGALFRNKVKSGLTAVGDSALYYNDVGSTELYHATSNTAVGIKALYANRTGYGNTAHGALALVSNTTGYTNTASGLSAMYSNTSGSLNSSTGYRSLFANTSGSFNTVNGSHALFNNTTGHSNVAIGIRALYSDTTHSNLVAVGDSALFFNNAYSNTAVGSKAMYSNTSGSGNTAQGFQALYSNSNGSSNTVFGYKAFDGNTSGSSNTVIGYMADATAINLTNATAIGANAVVGDHNTMAFGSSSVNNWAFGKTEPVAGTALQVGTNSGNGNGAYLTEGGAWTNGSSGMIKENFIELNGDDVLSKINQLAISSWNYKGTPVSEKHIGPMAEQFYDLFGTGLEGDREHISTIDPAGVGLIGIQVLAQRQEALITQMEALNAKNEIQQNRIKDLKSENDKLSQRLASIETLLGIKGHQ